MSLNMGKVTDKFLDSPFPGLCQKFAIILSVFEQTKIVSGHLCYETVINVHNVSVEVAWRHP